MDLTFLFLMSYNSCWIFYVTPLQFWALNLAPLSLILGLVIYLLVSLVSGWMTLVKLIPNLPNKYEASDVVPQGLQPCECSQLRWDGSGFSRALFIYNCSHSTAKLQWLPGGCFVFNNDLGSKLFYRLIQLNMDTFDPRRALLYGFFPWIYLPIQPKVQFMSLTNLPAAP